MKKSYLFNVLAVLLMMFSVSCSMIEQLGDQLVNNTPIESDVTINITNSDEFLGCTFEYDATINDSKIIINPTEDSMSKVTVNAGDLEITVKALKDGVVIAEGTLTMAIGAGKLECEITLVKTYEPPVEEPKVVETPEAPVVEEDDEEEEEGFEVGMELYDLDDDGNKVYYEDGEYADDENDQVIVVKDGKIIEIKSSNN